MRTLVGKGVFVLLLGLLVILGVVSCFSGQSSVPDWRKGILYIAVSPTSLQGEERFEIELATLFAQQQNVSLKLIPLRDEFVEDALRQHQVHFSATAMRAVASSTVLFAPPYQMVAEALVCLNATPQRLNQLKQRQIVIAAGSTQAQALASLAERLPDLHWVVQAGKSANQLLQEVAQGQLDCTVANEQQLALARTFYPQLGDELDLHSPSNLAWAFAADVDPTLFRAVRKFFETLKQDGRLLQMLDRHFGHNERLEAVDLNTFRQNIQTQLPKYKALFQQAAAKTGFDWKLLAALAYQESHWNPLATSFTKVRGMMMLTEQTAQRMEMTDRLDAGQSILAGARYLKMLKDSLPARISEQERTWMALAAYNQGMGHLEDARVLAARSGLNPDIWFEVRQVMPLLAQEAYYEHSKHGQMRGGEAVILVETVRLYQQILQTTEASPTILPWQQVWWGLGWLKH